MLAQGISCPTTAHIVHITTWRLLAASNETFERKTINMDDKNTYSVMQNMLNVHGKR